MQVLEYHLRTLIKQIFLSIFSCMTILTYRAVLLPVGGDVLRPGRWQGIDSFTKPICFLTLLYLATSTFFFFFLVKLMKLRIGEDWLVKVTFLRICSSEYAYLIPSWKA